MLRTHDIHERSGSILSLTLLVLGLVAYLIVGLSNLAEPGLQFDEAADAVPALELLHGLPNSAFSTINLFGVRLPTMLNYYIGPASIYTSLAGMAIFGTTVAGLRITQLLVGLITLLLLYALGRAWFSPLAAGLSVILCATSPAFIWWSRAGAHFSLPLLPLALGLYLLLRSWWVTHKPGRLALAAFIFGLGLTTKLLFVWLAVPLGLTALITLGFRGMWKRVHEIPLVTLALCLLAAVIGFLPFILLNLPTGSSLQFIAANALQSRAYGHNNLNVLANVQFETADFLRMMGGDTLHFGAPAGIPLGAIAVVISLFYTSIWCIRNRKAKFSSSDADCTRIRADVHLRLLLLLSVITIVPLMTISISSIGARHLFIIVPLAWLLVALMILDGVAWLRVHLLPHFGLALSGVLIAILPLNAIVTNGLILSFMNVYGGRGLWSDAIYSLANVLATRYADRHIMALDWGFERSATFLTQGTVRMNERYEYLPKPSPEFMNVATAMLQDPSNIYVFHAPGVTAFPGHLEVMQRAAARLHKQLVPLESIPERDGTPNTLIFGAQVTPRSFVVSPTLATRNAVFSGSLTLLGGIAGYDANLHEVNLKLYWQNKADHQPDDTVLVHIVNQANGEVVLTADQQPLYGAYPFSQWQKGEVVVDERWIQLPSELKPGIYQVRVGVYDTKTGVRRAINDPLHDAAGNSLMLHFFEIH